MTSRDFCYWLMGYMELHGTRHPQGIELTARQCGMIEKHLQLVFKHEIDPSMGAPAHQESLNAIHAATSCPAKTDAVMRC